jgi:protein phosphatase
MAGELASGIFLRTARDLSGNSGLLSEHRAAGLIRSIFLEANSSILNHARLHPECRGMGCTAELLVFHPGGFVLGHMGDSRTFRLRNGDLKQLTRDHSLVQEQLDQGLITPDEARGHSFTHVILRAVGIEENPSLDLLRGRLLPGDLFLLCSDGLTDMVGASLIRMHLMTYAKSSEKVNRLVELANRAGGRDNITAVIAEENTGF